MPAARRMGAAITMADPISRNLAESSPRNASRCSAAGIISSTMLAATRINARRWTSFELCGSRSNPLGNDTGHHPEVAADHHVETERKADCEGNKREPGQKTRRRNQPLRRLSLFDQTVLHRWNDQECDREQDRSEAHEAELLRKGRELG